VFAGNDYRVGLQPNVGSEQGILVRAPSFRSADFDNAILFELFERREHRLFAFNARLPHDERHGRVASLRPGICEFTKHSIDGKGAQGQHRAEVLGKIFIVDP